MSQIMYWKPNNVAILLCVLLIVGACIRFSKFFVMLVKLCPEVLYLFSENSDENSDADEHFSDCFYTST